MKRHFEVSKYIVLHKKHSNGIFEDVEADDIEEAIAMKASGKFNKEIHIDWYKSNTLLEEPFQYKKRAKIIIEYEFQFSTTVEPDPPPQEAGNNLANSHASNQQVF